MTTQRPISGRTVSDRTGEPSAATVSVIVVFYGGEGLRACLTSALAQPGVAEVILVNNRGAPPWPAELGSLPEEDSRLAVIHGQGNVGFGAGCNLGAAKARGDILLLLNPDCRLAPNTVPHALALAPKPPDTAWLLGPRMLNPDGSEQAGGRRNAGTPAEWLSETLRLDRLAPYRWPPVNRHRQPLPSEPVVEMPAVSGACMMVPRAFFHRVGDFDDSYFLHFEDLALCRAVWRTGGRVLFAPPITVTHLKSRSPVSSLFVTRHKIRSFRRYLWTEFGRPAGDWPAWRLAAIWALLSAGLLTRTLLGAARAWLRPRPSPEPEGQPDLGNRRDQ